MLTSKKFRITALLFSIVLLAAMLLCSAAAHAAGPRISYRVGKVEKIHPKGEDPQIRVVVVFKNNSTDEKVVTKIYDKNVVFSGKFKAYYHDAPFVARAKTFSNRVNTMDLWPGKEYSMYFVFKLKDFSPRVNPDCDYRGLVSCTVDFKYSLRGL